MYVRECVDVQMHAGMRRTEGSAISTCMSARPRIAAAYVYIMCSKVSRQIFKLDRLELSEKQQSRLTITV